MSLACVDRHLRAGGASTLATQTEKFRHSPEGRTPGVVEELRPQMLTATAHAYIDGPKTIEARRHIMTAYLNSEPLGSRPGYGEIIGVPAEAFGAGTAPTSPTPAGS